MGLHENYIEISYKPTININSKIKQTKSPHTKENLILVSTY